MQHGVMQQLHTPPFLQHCRLGIPKTTDVVFSPTYAHISAGTPGSYRQPPIHGCCPLPAMLGEGCSGKHVPTPPRCSSGPPVIGGE